MSFWSRRDDSLDGEFRDHFDRLVEENIEAGMPPAEARRAARRTFGRTLPAKEETRATWGWLWIERFIQDLRYGCRMLAHSPGFTFVAVLSIALGIGANTAIFSFSDTLLLRPLPVARPGELFLVGSTSVVEGLGGSLGASYPEFLDIRDRSGSFTELSAFGPLSAAVARSADVLPRVARGSAVSGNFFDVMGVSPVIGRGFSPEEDTVPNRDAVVVLGYEFWMQELAGDQGILGGEVFLNGVPFTVIGVAPKGFGVDRYVRTAFYVPLMMEPTLLAVPDILERRAARNLDLRGRLGADVTLDQARAELTVIGDTLGREYPDTSANRALLLRTELQDRVASDSITASLLAMMTALALVVLAVACANVSGLLAGRAPTRAREIAMRLAIGASRPRVMRQLITESLLVALLGGAAGIALGCLGILALARMPIPVDTPLSLTFTLDRRVLGASLAATLFSAILFGLAPAIRNARASLVDVMKSTSSANGGGARRQWGRGSLVVAQVALSVMVLVIGFATYRAFGSELLAGPGYRTDHLLMLQIDPQLVGYDATQRQRFLETLRDDVRALPGVRSATYTSRVPMGFSGGAQGIVPEGYQLPPGADRLTLLAAHVDESYFTTMDTAIVAGRPFRREDDREAPLVAIVNELAARQFWPSGRAVGSRFRLGNDRGPLVEVVGVARNTKYAWLAEPPLEFLYLPYRQHPQPRMTLMVESVDDAAALATPVREAIRALDPQMPISDMRTMESFYDQRVVQAGWIIVQAVGAMGLIGLALAVVGVYGLVAQTASQRTKEIGIRMAIGADPSSVIRLVLGQGVKLATIGLVAGLPAGIAVQRMMQAVFPARSTFDPLPLLIVVPVVLGVAFLASYLPARHAAGIDPLRVLRSE